MGSKSCGITSIGCAGFAFLLVMAPVSLLGQGNLAATVLFVIAGLFGLRWYQLAAERYRKGGWR